MTGQSRNVPTVDWTRKIRKNSEISGKFPGQIVGRNPEDPENPLKGFPAFRLRDACIMA